jgi:hypothetical protein
MDTETDPAYIASLPLLYFTENVSAPLLHVFIAMAVLQTMFITLFFMSRLVFALYTSNDIIAPGCASS